MDVAQVLVKVSTRGWRPRRKFLLSFNPFQCFANNWKVRVESHSDLTVTVIPPLRLLGFVSEEEGESSLRRRAEISGAPFLKVVLTE